MAYIVPFPDESVFCERNDIQFVYPGQTVLPNDRSTNLALVEGPNSRLTTAGTATVNQADPTSVTEAALFHQFMVRCTGSRQTIELPFWWWPNRFMTATGTSQNPTFAALPRASVMNLNKVTSQSSDNLGRYVQFECTVQVPDKDGNLVNTPVIAPAGCYWNAGDWLWHAARPRFPASATRSIFRAHPFAGNPHTTFGLTSGPIGTGEVLRWYNGDGIPGNPQSRDVKVHARLLPQEYSLPASPDVYGPYTFGWIEDTEYLNAQAAARRGSSGNAGQADEEEPPGPSGQAGRRPRDAGRSKDGDAEFEKRVARAAMHIYDQGYKESNGVDRG